MAKAKKKPGRPKKEKVSTNTLLDQLKSIDSDQLQELFAQLLEKKNSQEKPPAKKRGRPPKFSSSKSSENKEIAQETQSTKPVGQYDQFIAPTRPVKKQVGGEKIERDGKEYTVMRKEPFVVGAKRPNKFKDTGKDVPREKLNYPDPEPRREPAQKQVYICDNCNKPQELYPGERGDPNTFFKCDRCLTGMKR